MIGFGIGVRSYLLTVILDEAQLGALVDVYSFFLLADVGVRLDVALGALS